MPLAQPRDGTAQLANPLPAEHGTQIASVSSVTTEAGVVAAATGAAEACTVNLEGVLALEADARSERNPRSQTAECGAVGERHPDPDPEGPSLAKRLAVLLQPPLEVLLARGGALEWPAEFFPYQRDGIHALVRRDALLLADDMGLGKTVQAIAAVRILIHTHRAESVLLVVPASLTVQWSRGFRDWAPELRTSTVSGPAGDRAWKWKTPAHVYIVSYETLRADFTDNPQSPPRRRVWDVVVLDEAQRIKNRDTEVSRECKRLQRRRAWALTGTPLENRIDDLASICEFLAPWQEGDAEPHLEPGDALLMRQRELQLRRKKEDVLPELPSKTVSEIVLQLGADQRGTYEDAEQRGIRHLRDLGQTARIAHVLELIQRLKQICNFCSRTGESAKLDDIEQRLDTLVAEGHRALLFSQYTDSAYGVAAIEARLVRFSPVAYTGALSTQQRDRVVQSFKARDDHKVLVLSLRTGGQGLNLQEASYVFHFDRWWNPAVERQAEDRSHRLGQTLPVTVYKYVCEDTIEERIDAVLREKQALFDHLVDDVSIDLEKHLTADELFGLFGLAAPARERRPRSTRRSYQGMKGEEFERYLADLLRRLEWSVEPTPASRDGGVDLCVTKQDQIGVETRLYIQCKNQAAPVSVEIVRELRGVLDPNVQGVVAAPGGFTADARRFADDVGIQLWNADHVSDLAAAVIAPEAEAGSDSEAGDASLGEHDVTRAT